MLLPRLGYEGRGLVFNSLSPSFLFSIFFESPTNCHVVNALKHTVEWPTWGGAEAKNQRGLTPVNISVRELCRQTPQPQPSVEMTATQADNLTATL